MKKINVERDAKDFASPYKVALIATHDEQKDVHITLLSSLMNRGDDEMVVGEFVKGLSKEFFHERPQAGFLIMNLAKEFWTGTMDFYDKKTEGPEYIAFNEMTLFRFNTYFGVHTVHYAKLREISEKRKLNMAGIGANMVRVILGGPFFRGRENQVFNPWTRQHTAKAGTLLFLGFTGSDGYPRLLPVIQGKSVSKSRILLTLAPYKKLGEGLKDGDRASLFAANLDMEAVLLKGTYRKLAGGFGAVDIDRVYNSMPPIHRYIYPETPWAAVTEF
ncbi:MAG: hypothetical protein GX819_03015 [Clostridiaceae bacterium]|nr:hypothetical protein [Clostridiaceae bacterium]